MHRHEGMSDQWSEKKHTHRHEHKHWLSENEYLLHPSHLPNCLMSKVFKKSRHLRKHGRTGIECLGPDGVGRQATAETQTLIEEVAYAKSISESLPSAVHRLREKSRARSVYSPYYIVSARQLELGVGKQIMCV
eukprot:6397939-Amphidinium_carterae.1